jgi:elongation factor Ts
MAFTAADVKRLREETGAPMMECSNALREADGDFEKAKALLREKGIAAAGKRAGRETNAGVVAVASNDDGTTVGAVVLESETDFVAKNPEFLQIAQELAETFRDTDPGSDPMAVPGVREKIEGAIGKIRENIKISKALRLTGNGPLPFYVHHDKTKGAIIVGSGDNAEALRKVAIQVVSNPPEVVSKDQLSQEMLDKEIEIETQRAVNEGKDEKIARNIAQGRVNKEFVKKAALLEQPFYMDNSKSVQQFLQEEAKGAQVKEFIYLSVGGQ